MRIIFDLRGTGLGDNGGSLTLVKSANTLHDLNHEVFIIDSGKNQHSWNKLKASHIIIKKDSDIPDSDVIIATGYNTVKYSINAPSRCGKKFHWIRGFETWVMNEQEILKHVFNQPIRKIVNSICLQKKLKEYNLKSDICRPGYDFDELYPIDIRGESDQIWFGGLYHTRHETKKSQLIIDVVNELKQSYPNISLSMMGLDMKTSKHVDYYIQSPNIKTKNNFYNRIDIFLSTSILEGLHIVPAEAMLTECCVIGVDTPMAGTQDYLIDMKTGYVCKNSYDHLLSKMEESICNLDMTRKLGKNGRKKILELGDRKSNMKKMIDILNS